MAEGSEQEMTNPPNPPEPAEVPAGETVQEWRQPTEVPAEVPGGEPWADAEEEDQDGAERGIPAGGALAGGATGAGVLGEALWQVGGLFGLAAGAVVAAGGVVTYVAYRLRGKDRRRSPFGRPARGRSASGRMLGGRGAKLGKGGRLLGGRSGRLLGGKGARLGKGGGPRLGKGGRGGGLGGKLGRKGSGGRPLGGGRVSRLGMTGGKGGRGLLGRGGKAGRAGLGLGARGGKLLGGKGRAGFGRWGRAAGGGASVLGRGLGKAARRSGRGAVTLAGKTRAGKHTARGFKAARAALRSGGWSGARKAARSALGTPRSRYAAWAASVGAAVLALSALLHDKYKARKANPQPTTTTSTTTTATTTATTSSSTTTTTTTTTGTHGGIPYIDQPLRALGPGAATRTTTTHTSTTHTRTTARSRTMEGGFPLATAAAEVTVAAASYEPGDMWTVATDLRQLPDVFASVALALRTYSQRLEDYALEQPVRQELASLYAGLSQLAQHAQELEPLFRAVHADDLKRGEQPRTGEAGWNV